MKCWWWIWFRVICFVLMCFYGLNSFKAGGAVSRRSDAAPHQVSVDRIRRFIWKEQRKAVTSLILLQLKISMLCFLKSHLACFAVGWPDVADGNPLADGRWRWQSHGQDSCTARVNQFRRMREPETPHAWAGSAARVSRKCRTRAVRRQARINGQVSKDKWPGIQ